MTPRERKQICHRAMELVSEADCDVREDLQTRDDRYEIRGITPAKVNRMFAEFLAKGMKTTGYVDEDGDWTLGDYVGGCDTHTAIVVCVEPIAKEPEDSEALVLQALAEYDAIRNGNPSFRELVERARKLKGMK